MMRRSLATLSLLLAATAPLGAQATMNHDPDKKMDGGALPAGWSGRTDRENQKLSDAKFVTMGTGFHVSSGPAAIYWKESIEPTGAFTAKATFRQTKAPTHPEAYGMLFMGKKLEGGDQTYAYLLVRGDGKVMVKHRAGKDLHTIMDWTDNAAVNKQDASGVATNTIMIDASRADSIRLMVNGAQVSAFEGGYMGGAAGHVGLRVNHNLDVHISDFVVTPSAGGKAAMAPGAKKQAKKSAKAARKAAAKP